jgi:hypothetical protein
MIGLGIGSHGCGGCVLLCYCDAVEKGRGAWGREKENTKVGCVVEGKVACRESTR